MYQPWVSLAIAGPAESAAAAAPASTIERSFIFYPRFKYRRAGTPPPKRSDDNGLITAIMTDVSTRRLRNRPFFPAGWHLYSGSVTPEQQSLGGSAAALTS